MSNTKNSLLSQIHDKELSWNAKVLVSRVWQFRGGTDTGPVAHIDIVVLDQEGTHMYGQIPPDLAKRVKDVLQEGNVYQMNRFMCKQSKQSYRAVESPYMMQFTRFSTIVPAPGNEEDYPYCTYSLVSFPDIPAPGPRTPRFLDVVGRITAVTDIVVVHSQHQAEPSDTRSIVLQDQLGNEITLVLWGERAREFDAEDVRAASEKGAVVAIFVGTLPKVYRGIKGLSGSSACRWYIDEDLPEINAFRASLPQGIAPVTAHITGQQPMVATPVRDPPVEMSVSELLALDPFDNLKKQFLVKVVITRLGYDNRWWFLSCRDCHKTAYVSGRRYRCSDLTCPSINADPSYCVCTFGSDGKTEAEFMWFDKSARSFVGKPVLTLIERNYPGFTSIHDLAQIGGGDVMMPTEISRIVTQKFALVVSISSKSFQPTSTQLSFQVGRVDRTFKPELPSLGFAGASGASGASSSAENFGAAAPILSSFPAGSATLNAIPLDEMNTPISAFKSKGSKSPCPKSSRRKLTTSPLKIRDAEVKGPEPPASAAGVTVDSEKSASTGDIVEAVPVTIETKEDGEGSVPAATGDGKDVLEPIKNKRASAALKNASAPKKARQ